MLKNKVIVLIMIVSILLVFVNGCKSTPEQPKTDTPVEEVAPETAPVVETVESAKFTDEQLMEMVDKARAQAIENGSDKLFADELALADKQYEETKKSSDLIQKDSDECKNRYDAMNYAAQATKNKERIEGLEFVNYDKASYDQGCLDLTSYSELLANQASTAEKLEKANSAYTNLQKVLDAGFLSLSDSKKKEVADVKNNALSIKANKADKVGFDAAQLLLSTADTEYVANHYESSYNYYSKAQTAFEDVYQNVLVKRTAAEEAIARAKSKADAVDQFAAEADTIAPLPEVEEAAQPSETIQENVQDNVEQEVQE